jgi:hypothetical protein
MNVDINLQPIQEQEQEQEQEAQEQEQEAQEQAKEKNEITSKLNNYKDIHDLYPYEDGEAKQPTAVLNEQADDCKYVGLDFEGVGVVLDLEKG